MPLIIDRNKVQEVLESSSSPVLGAGSILIQQYAATGMTIAPEGPVTISGTNYSVPVNLQAEREHLLSLRERIGNNLLTDEQLRERLHSLR